MLENAPLFHFLVIFFEFFPPLSFDAFWSFIFSSPFKGHLSAGFGASLGPPDRAFFSLCLAVSLSFAKKNVFSEQGRAF